MDSPTISVQPSNLTVWCGATATFTVTVVGTPPLVYRWCKNGDLLAAGSNTYSFVTVAGDNSASIYCTISNGLGSVTSNTVTLTVNLQPTESRVENFQADVVTAVTAISRTVSGYRTTVSRVTTQLQDLGSLSLLPQVSVLLGQEKMYSINANKTVWQSEVDCYLLGYCKQSDMEALIHDLKRVMVALAPANVSDSTNRWIIKTNDPGSVIVSRDILPGTEKGWVCVQFNARVMYQANTL